MSIKDLFLKLTKSTMPNGHEKLMENYFPKGWKKDFHGNYYIKIGDPTTMFTSHIDTVDSGQPKEVIHVINGNIIGTNGKTILGADDKAGTTIMIHMIEQKKEGLYYFFLNEEHGCIGSNALKRHLESNKEDELYKKITKVVSLDRGNYDSVITHQMEQRCCSDEFGDELAKRLNEAGGFKYKKDHRGAVTDSHHLAGIFSECTNLSVGYTDQHSVREEQNIDFLANLAEVCVKVNWETLPTKRDQTKVDTKVDHSYYRNSNYHGSEWNNDRWWEGGGYDAPTIKSTSVGPSVIRNAEFVNDYLGNQIKTVNAQWCEYDKQWCDKKEAIWVEYIGFYTTPDFDPTKVKKKEVAGSGGSLKPIVMNDIKKDIEVYTKSGELFGTIANINDKITILTTSSSKFIIPPNKFMTYGFKMKDGVGNNKLTENDLKEGMLVKHPTFGEGKIIGIRPNRDIVKVLFKDKGEKDLRVDVATMTF